MRNLNSVVFTAIMMSLSAPNIANAGSWICEHGTLVREISVERETGAAAPCSVLYNKDSEGLGSKALWTASNDGAYCEEKADGLAEKLQGYGWVCDSF